MLKRLLRRAHKRDLEQRELRETQRRDAKSRCDAFVEYIRAHYWIEGLEPDVSSGEVLRLAPRLGDEHVALSEKKYLLVMFAHAESEAALTALEWFAGIAEPALRHFASYALQEAKARRGLTP